MRATRRSSRHSDASPASSIPDVSGDPEAGHRFRAIAEAYEVLSDPGRRQTYDRFGHAGLRRGGFAPMDADFGSLADVFAAFFGDAVFGQASSGTRSRRAGPDVAAHAEIELAEALTGTTLDVGVRVARTCASCGGTAPPRERRRARVRAAAVPGAIQQVSRTVLGQIVRTGACPRCDGTGSIVERPCERCEGDGRTLETDPARAGRPRRDPRRPANPGPWRGARRRARWPVGRRLRLDPGPAARGRRA